MDSHPQRGSVMSRHRWMSRCLLASTTVLMVAVGGSAALAQPIETTPAVPTTTQSTPATTSPDLVPLDTPAETTTVVDPCAVPTTTPPATTTTPPPTTTTTTPPVAPAECVTTPAAPEPVTPTPASETVPEPASPPVTAAQEPEPAPPTEDTLAPVPAEMIPAAPAADQPIAPDDPELSSKTAGPDLDWAPTENPNATLVPGQMRSDREEIPAPFTKEDADKAEMMEAQERSTLSRMSIAAVTCQTYWPSPFQVCGAIRDKYNSLGGPASFLTYPTSGNITNPDGIGQRVTFLNGPIYWHPDTGAHPVVNSFLNRWGILQYEAAAGMLGYPTTDEIVHADGVGRRQEFQRGAIYVAFQNAIGSAIRNGLIRDKWNTVGAHEPGSLLGYPIQDPMDLPDGQGRMSRFERGVIYWHPSTGAWPVTGSLLSKWEQSGYESGAYGYPISDARSRPGSGEEQDFQWGTMGWLTDIADTMTGDDQGDIGFIISDGTPNTYAEFAADAAVGIDPSDPVTSGGGTLLVNNPGSGPATPDPEDPNIEGPDTGGYFIPTWCTTGTWDGTWRGNRKNACAVKDTFAWWKNISGGPDRFAAVTIKTGVLSSHRTGIMKQEVRLEFGKGWTTAGTPTLQYEGYNDGYNSGSFSVEGPAPGTVVHSGMTIVLVVTWNETSLADNAIEARNFGLKISFGNDSPNLSSTTDLSVGTHGFRCDKTMRNSAGLKQGCVWSSYTPQFWLSPTSHANPVPEAAGHIQKALESGLPGGSPSQPLHRQANNATRDINRQAACPRSGDISRDRAVSGRTCDEYPFASTTEGGYSSGGTGRTFNPECHIPDLSAGTGPTGFSVCMIDGPQNSRAGSYLGAFYGVNRVINQDPFWVSVSGGSLPPAP